MTPTVVTWRCLHPARDDSGAERRIRPTRHPADTDTLLALADDHLTGTASPDDVRRLEALLAASPAARRTYLGLALVHAQLGATLAALPSPPRLRSARTPPLD